MQIIVRIILLALLPVVCVCCDRPDRGLLRIEQAMKADPYPARALAMLDSVDSAGFGGNRASAVLHGLLRSELLLKNRLPLATDSMLEAAAEYYAAHNDPLRHAEALHYSALWHLNQADYPGAMRRSAAALDVASAIPDTLLMARSHEVMAFIYNGTYNINGEIRHRRTANILYGRTPDIASEVGEYGLKDCQAEDAVKALNIAVDCSVAEQYRVVGIEASLMKYRRIALLFIAFMFVFGLLLYWIADIQRERAGFITRLGEIEQTCEILCGTNKRFSQTIRNLIKEYLAGVLRLYEMQSMLPSSSPEAEKIYRRIRHELDSLSSDEVRTILVHAVNDSNDGIIDRLDHDFPNLKAEDRLVFALKACDVPSQIISLFLNVQVSGYYSRRTRLIKKIENSSSPDKKNFLDLLS